MFYSQNHPPLNPQIFFSNQQRFQTFQQPRNFQSQNVFKPNPNLKFPKPEPMGTSTISPNRKQQQQYQPQQRQNRTQRPSYTFEELFYEEENELNNHIEDKDEVDNNNIQITPYETKNEFQSKVWITPRTNEPT